ncbi:MarC family protein [uncultured Sunxiuqinia sp.]|uniref:MarC family protein n=1 Tax=uncultured Sunxiuqinia sp. TaxID=1573825 RepID=UPI002AA812BB|nr:MarC family protein [uncultured Sunxiuqinia sp.]
MNWDYYINFLVAMFAIVNPIGIWPVWSDLTNDAVSSIRHRIAFLLILSAVMILSVFFGRGQIVA